MNGPRWPLFLYRPCMADETRDKARAGWDERAPAWARNRDYMWGRTRHVSEWLVEQEQASPGDTILDLAGGPGDNGFLAAERVGPSGKVIETDFSPQMVEMARRRADELGLNQVDTRVMDAESMDLPDDSVDGIICRWGLMLMSDPQAVLSECRRVLKQGRRLAFSVWGSPEQNPWVTVVGKTMIQLGYQPAMDPTATGGIFSLAEQERIESLLTAAGFSVLAREEMAVDWRFGSFEEAWGYMTEMSGVLETIIKELSSREVDRLRSTFEANVQSFRTGSGITLPGVTINVAAV